MRVPHPGRSTTKATAAARSLRQPSSILACTTIDERVIRRGDGVLATVLACSMAGGYQAASLGQAEARLIVLRRLLADAATPLQLVLDLAPLDPEPFCRQHTRRLGHALHPTLAQLTHSLYATVRDHGRLATSLTLTAYLIISQPPAADPADALAALDERCRSLIARLVEADIQAARLAGADCQRLLARWLTGGARPAERRVV